MPLDLTQKIIACRDVIRYHRDQIGDDRCLIDDYKVWNMAEDKPSIFSLPTFDEGMKLCTAFYEFRQAAAADPQHADAIADRAAWDLDLNGIDDAALVIEWHRIQAAICRHRDIKDRPRTVDDDRALYAILPEKIAADFRLPLRKEFLGEAKAPHAGCPSFWRSHANCPVKEHDFGHWGPCKLVNF